MNIIGIGVDLVNIERVQQKLTRSSSFAEKILTSTEYDIFLKTQESNKAAYVAKCWAVKEAFAKANGTGFTSDLTWKDISYVSNGGPPSIVLDTRINNNNNIHLSVSDENDSAIAFIIISNNC